MSTMWHVAGAMYARESTLPPWGDAGYAYDTRQGKGVVQGDPLAPALSAPLLEASGNMSAASTGKASAHAAQ